jgi:hypothetical protein
MRSRYEFKQASASITITGKLEIGSAFYFMSAPIYEPVERNHDGMRFHRHRFPIKGGISRIEVTERQMSKPGALYDAFFKETANAAR